MDHRSFEQQLAGGGLPSVLLFEGEEEQMKQAAFRKLRQTLLPEGMEQMNETVLENPETDQLIAASETLPFLAEKRLVVIRDFAPLTGRGEGDERLIAYLPTVPSTTLLLFYCAGKADGRKKLYTTIRKLDGIVSFSPLKGAELTRFVTDAFHTLGKECDARTAEYLIFTSGSDTGILLAEATKIASFARDRPQVLAENVTALATPSTECTVFQMVDAVVAGQQSRALLLTRNLLLTGTDRLQILALLLRQYRLLQHVKIMQYEKKSRDYIRSALGLAPFIVDQYLRQASSFTGGQVKKAVSLCLETEYAVKSGRALQDSALENVMIRLLTLRQKG